MVWLLLVVCEQVLVVGAMGDGKVRTKVRFCKITFWGSGVVKNILGVVCCFWACSGFVCAVWGCDGGVLVQGGGGGKAAAVGSRGVVLEKCENMS